MEFDVGKSLASGLAQGVVFAAIGSGWYFVSQKLRDRKQRIWDEAHQGLSAEELAEAKLAQERRDKRRVYKRWMVILGLCFAFLMFVKFAWG